MPAGVPAGTVIVPPSAMVTPVSPPGSVTVIVVSAGLTVAPFRRSLVSTLPAEPPVKPFSAVAVKSSSTASMTGGLIRSVTRAVSQLPGFRSSQSRYSTV